MAALASITCSLQLRDNATILLLPLIETYMSLYDVKSQKEYQIV